MPCALMVASWDNLTCKGAIQVTPDLVTVWNAFQHREAEAMHGVPRERIVVTGAQLYDQWFAMRPAYGWARYETPVKGLFLCGAGTHPGGFLTGTSGRLAAERVLRG